MGKSTFMSNVNSGSIPVWCDYHVLGTTLFFTLTLDL